MYRIKEAHLGEQAILGPVVISSDPEDGGSNLIRIQSNYLRTHTVRYAKDINIRV